MYLRFLPALALLLSSSPLYAGFSEGPCAQADIAYQSMNNAAALEGYQRCLESAKSMSPELAGVIAKVALIALRSNHLEEARGIFSALLAQHRDPAVRGAIAEWSAALSDVERYGAKDAESVPADKLYDDGTEQFLRAYGIFQEGLEDKAFPELQAAAGLLLPFIMRNEGDPRIARALLMMGVIKSCSWLEGDDLAALAYLKAAMYRAPNSPISKNAWRVLRRQVKDIASVSKDGVAPPHMLDSLVDLQHLE